MNHDDMERVDPIEQAVVAWYEGKHDLAKQHLHRWMEQAQVPFEDAYVAFERRLEARHVAADLIRRTRNVPGGTDRS